MEYYDIGLGVERHWNSAVFTYSSPETLSEGTIVRVPFGSKKKIGIVLKKVTKPSFTAKLITENLDLDLLGDTQLFMKWFKDFYSLEDSEMYSQFLPGYITKIKSPPISNQLKTVANPVLSQAIVANVRFLFV